MTEMDELLERLRKRWGKPDMQWARPGAPAVEVPRDQDIFATKTLKVNVHCNHAPCWCGAVSIANEPENCAECGGQLRLSTGPNREMNYRGESGLIIPENIEFPECPQCGATWMDGQTIDMLSEALEQQRAERKRERAKKGTEQ